MPKPFQQQAQTHANREDIFPQTMELRLDPLWQDDV
jgi:hypothetical protein